MLRPQEIPGRGSDAPNHQFWLVGLVGCSNRAETVRYCRSRLTATEADAEIGDGVAGVQRVLDADGAERADRGRPGRGGPGGEGAHGEGGEDGGGDEAPAAARTGRHDAPPCRDR